jgi:hypothetical protein
MYVTKISKTSFSHVQLDVVPASENALLKKTNASKTFRPVVRISAGRK